MTANDMKEQIEAYLFHKLSEEQTLEFERAMRADSALAREVEELRSIIEAFEHRGEASARKALERLDSEQTLRAIIRRAEHRGSKRGRRIRLGAWCASAAAAVGVLLFIGLTPEYSSNELYNTYFTPQQHFELPPSRGGAEIPDDVRLNRALELMQAGQRGAAIGILRLVADDNESELQDAARWNLALALLREGQRREAVGLLDRLITGKNEYADKANVLKTEIEKRKWF